MANDANDGEPPRRDASTTELTELEILRMRTRATATAIAIPDEESSSDEEEEEYGRSFYAASPGASSTVARPESWRPFPPPMLGSSYESRQVPSLRPKETAAKPAYGAAALAAAAEVLRREQPKGTEALPTERRSGTGSAPWRAKISKAAIQLQALRRAPRELWLVFSLKLLSSYAYFSLSLILTTFLTDEFGLSDYAAGWAYGTYGVMSTFFGIVCGWFIDYLGVRLALLLGAIIGAIARLMITFTTSRHLAMIMLYTLLPFAECLGIPIMTIAIKRYTNARNRTFAFSLFYSMMNVAALLAGPAVDISRSLFRNGIIWDLRSFGIDAVLRLTGLRVVVLSSAIATGAMGFVVLLGVREVEVDETGNVQDFSPNRTSPLQQTLEVLKEPAFWRLTVFTFLLVAVRLVFRHLDATMPKYLVRQFGPNAPYGLIYSINPFLIIVLVPFVGLATRGISSFSMILYGSFIAAASPFWICVAPAYWTVILFMITLSIGEAIYSPRVYEYTMEVSGRGNEGLYSSLSSAPLFSVKLLVGGMSGWLLTTFMNVNGPHHGGTMWGIIGITSSISPVLMFLLKDYISHPDDASRAEKFGRRRVNSRASLVTTPSTAVLAERTPLVTGAKPPVWKATVPLPIDGEIEFDQDAEQDDSVPLSAQSPHSVPRSSVSPNLPPVMPRAPK